MSNMLLNKRADVWRRVGTIGSFADTEVYNQIPCAFVPISKLDHTQPYNFEATHIILVPYWLFLRKEDELRYSRRPLDDYSDVQPVVFVLNGRTPYSQGGNQVVWYASERE
jgi:hypothetical protein